MKGSTMDFSSPFRRGSRFEGARNVKDDEGDPKRCAAVR